MGDEQIKLTERELKIAEKAAEIAVTRIMDDFYKGVGRSVVNRLLIIVGALVVAFAFGRGYIVWKE